jgi:hypothetical protein
MTMQEEWERDSRERLFAVVNRPGTAPHLRLLKQYLTHAKRVTFPSLRDGYQVLFDGEVYGDVAKGQYGLWFYYPVPRYRDLLGTDVADYGEQRRRHAGVALVAEVLIQSGRSVAIFEELIAKHGIMGTAGLPPVGWLR